MSGRIVAAVLVLAVVARADEAARITGADGAGMALVAGGAFVMGTAEGLAEEGPPRRVDVPSFYMDVGEVTCGQYAAYLKATGATAPAGWSGNEPPAGREGLPVTDVTWFEAMRYAIWAGKRLPTEAEWEKAARGTDGRRYPWGNADEAGRRNVQESGKLLPPGSMPTGASPYGVMDLSGNAWEWTADWYEGYPGTRARSVQFGRKYKVVRGGGAIYYYGLQNTGTTTARARALPYGSHDGIGFRCVKDADPAKRPYDPKAALAEAEQRLGSALREPRRLGYEDEYAGYLKAGGVPLRVVGQGPAVRSGVALPKGLVKDVGGLRVLGPDGRPRLTQAAALAKWADGSARWALLDFPATAGETCVLRFGGASEGAAQGAAQEAALKVSQNEKQIEIDTGPVKLTLTREGLLRQLQAGNGSTILEGMRVRLTTAQGELDSAAAETMELEEAGPVRATVRFGGKLSGRGLASAFEYGARVGATAGSSRVDVQVTITHQAARSASVAVRDASVRFVLGEAAREVVLGTDGGAQTIASRRGVVARQVDDLRYEVSGSSGKVSEGTRLAGWIAARSAGGYAVVGVVDFWRNWPAALVVGPQSVAVRTWSGSAPLEWEGGLAKTHDLVLDFAKGKPEGLGLGKLWAVMPAAWACGTEAFGAPLLPRGAEALGRFGYWELYRAMSMREWVRGMPTGFRDFGDAYMGGPYKGKNAYANQEYDVSYNFLMEYLRSGDAWYLDAVGPMARHQADIDTNHFTGQPWKHSPQHTTTEAELGHVFTRGLQMHYLLTGDRRSLEVARRIGDWIAAVLEKGEGTGNERQIGWSLYALTGLYDVTGDAKYLHACETLCKRLLAGQAQTGQFTNIRWDNRIAFFNGIAMNGMLTVYEHSRDEKLAEGIMKVARRTLGMYPEYACRTLNAFIWAARRTNDPRYLDAIERTWELSTEYLPDAVTSETHAWHFRQFAASQGLFPLFEAAPGALPDSASWSGMRLEGAEAEVYIEAKAQGPAALMVIREGHAQGQAQVLDAAGRLVQSVELNDEGRVFEAAAVALPRADGVYRLRLYGPKARAWQVHHDASSRLTVCDPSGALLRDLYPRAYGLAEEGTKQISIRLEAMGEGFHMATLYDPEGRVAKTVRHFVDFEDPGRYELELKLEGESALASGPWSVEVYKAKVIGVKGMLPYWAGEAGQLFHPERGGLEPGGR